MSRRPQTPAMRLRALLLNSAESLNESPTRFSLPLVHPFPAPMSPSLARTLIEKVAVKDAIVLDPMAGSGTVPAAALALGRSCYAMDIDHLALLAIRVQCGQQAPRIVEAAGVRVVDHARRLLMRPATLDRQFMSEFDDETRAFIARWFPKHARRGLLALWKAIRVAKPNEARTPLKIAFSRVIIAKTAGASFAIDLPHTRPHRKAEKKVPDPLVMFPSRLRELIRRMKLRPVVPNGAKLRVRRGDVRHLPYRDSSVDLVLTSSPYANAIDYMRSHKFSLVWMGLSVSKLAIVRGQMVGAEHGQRKVDARLQWLEGFLPTAERKLRARVAIFRRFFYDMDKVAQEVRRVLKPGGACVFILGQSYVGGHIIDTPSIIAKIAENHGFEHLGTAYRRLNSYRRSLPFPRAKGANVALGKRMDTEAIVALAR